MDYLAVFRPIFAYAAHLRLALPGQAGAGALPPDALGRLEAMLAQTHAQCGGNGALRHHFDAAWLALAAWLDQALNLGVAARYFPGVVPADAFFASLDALLADKDPGTANAEVLKVYATALDLGFGGNGGPETLAKIESCRRRCNKAVLRLVRPISPPPPAPRPDRRRLALAGDAAFWLVPPAVTIFLYSIYRILLSDLYASVVG